MSGKELNSYRFLSGGDPSDEMLESIMMDALECAMSRRREAEARIKEEVERERQLLREKWDDRLHSRDCHESCRRPELIVIAGPNGSGKTTVTQQFLKHGWSDGIAYINPDQVAKDIFGDWNSQKAVLDSANYCKEWRERCLKEKVSFVFETVFSAEDKIEFILRAKEAGFFIRMFFISTEHPSINAARITNRVIEGGHSVPIEKIITRYYKSILNCETIAGNVDRLYLYDNSIDGHIARLLFKLSNGVLIRRYVEDLPEWTRHVLPDTI